MHIYTVKGDTRITSSNTTNYHRKNILEKESLKTIQHIHINLLTGFLTENFHSNLFLKTTLEQKVGYNFLTLLYFTVGECQY